MLCVVNNGQSRPPGHRCPTPFPAPQPNRPTNQCALSSWDCRPYRRGICAHHPADMNVATCGCVRAFTRVRVHVSWWCLGGGSLFSFLFSLFNPLPFRLYRGEQPVVGQCRRLCCWRERGRPCAKLRRSARRIIRRQGWHEPPPPHPHQRYVPDRREAKENDTTGLVSTRRAAMRARCRE